MFSDGIFSPILTYILGATCLLFGGSNFFRPVKEYARFGLPLEGSAHAPPIPAYLLQQSSPEENEYQQLEFKIHHQQSSSYHESHQQHQHQQQQGVTGFASPLVYVKGSRDVTYGLTLMALQWQGGQETAITTLTGVMSLAGAVDGFVVWFYGGDKFVAKAFMHWAAFITFGTWALSRWASQQQQ